MAMTVFVNVVKAEDSAGNPVLVSMGDSYSSGEGIEPFIDQNIDHKENSQNWMAHRSELAWSGKLELKRRDGSSVIMSDDKDNWYFVADSGAKTDQLSSGYDKPWNFGPFNHGTTHMDAQLDVFDKISSEGKKADFVTLTIGGNDAGFADIIGQAATSFSYTSFLLPNRLSDTFDKAWDEFYKYFGTRDKIRWAYYDIADKAGYNAKIIVAGYPKLLSEQGGIIVPGLNFDPKEARMINNEVHKFNDELEKIVEECRRTDNLEHHAINIYFVSVEKAFEGHEAYSKVPYINPVMEPQEQELEAVFRPQGHEPTKWLNPTSSYSIHPDKNGAKLYAECIQNMIKTLMGETSDEETSPEPEEQPADNALTDFDLIGTWRTTDGVDLTFKEDGTYEMDWGFGVPESGDYSTGDISGSSFPITMEGSSILSMMQLAYGGAHSNYHFEVLVSNDDEIYLVQVYDNYTAETSPCKLYFSRR